MKPTNEERREVAEMLRRLAEEASKGNVHWEAEHIGRKAVLASRAFKRACGVDPLDEPGEELERYADLIEPEPERTCRAEERYRDDDSSPWPYYVCSECGERMNYREAMDEDCEMLPYCAGCGAKVVEE